MKMAGVAGRERRESWHLLKHLKSGGDRISSKNEQGYLGLKCPRGSPCFGSVVGAVFPLISAGNGGRILPALGALNIPFIN